MPFVGNHWKRYTVTVFDPLSPQSGVSGRLAVAAGLICLLWLLVWWAA
jgi:hypothetical protein